MDSEGYEDADKMSSLSQGQWMIWMAQSIAPKRGMVYSLAICTD